MCRVVGGEGHVAHVWVIDRTSEMLMHFKACWINCHAVTHCVLERFILKHVTTVSESDDGRSERACVDVALVVTSGL